MISSLQYSSLVLCVSALPSVVAADDWPNFYGPLRNGTSTATGVFESVDDVGAQERWRRPLGSGYAVLALLGGFVYTTHSGGAVNDTSPTFAGDRLFLRNHEEMVAVSVR